MAAGDGHALHLEADMTHADAISFNVNDIHAVSGLLQVPEKVIACYAVAHGAWAEMTHSFMAAVADGFAERRIATLRYQFPFMEQGSRRPDRPALAHATVRMAVETASRLAPSLPLVAGGKSFGRRMTSQAQAEAPLPDVRGLALLGFPLHPARKPSEDRAQHLAHVRVSMLFLQGTRDTLATMSLLLPLIERLGKLATLTPVQDADHSLHVPVRSRRTDLQVLAEVLDAMAVWIEPVARYQND